MGGSTLEFSGDGVNACFNRHAIDFFGYEIFIDG